VNNWTEADSSTYSEIADVAVPRRAEMMRALVDAVPFGRNESFQVVELGSGDGRLASAVLEKFPAAMITALDGSESMRALAAPRLAAFGERARVRPFNVASLDWWDQLFGADLVISSLCLHHLNDAKKQYLYKAVADRISSRGALLVADLVNPASAPARRLAAAAWDRAAQEQAEALGRPDLFARFVEVGWNHFRFPDPEDRPAAIFHHLVWLRHAGFAAVDCLWMYAGHAVFGGVKQSAASAGPLPADS
jgi:tRNA (cmo5U34)-methyltransferase